MSAVIERSRAKGLASVLGCAVFVLASLTIIGEGSALTLIVGAVGVLTFDWFGLAASRRIASSYYVTSQSHTVGDDVAVITRTGMNDHKRSVRI